MNNKLYTIIYTVFLFYLCCTCRKEKEEINTFEHVKIITEYDSLYSDKDILLGPITDMEIVDSILITKHMNDEYSFSFFNIKKGKLLCRYGRIGEAPGEYSQIGTGFDISNSQLIFLDNTKKEINYLPIYQLIKKQIGKCDSLTIRKEVYPYSKDFRPLRINLLRDKKIVVGMFKDEYIGVLDSNNTIMHHNTDFPFSYKEITGIHRGMAFQSTIKTNERQNRCVTVVNASDVFEIYEAKDTCFNKIFTSSFNHIPKIQMKGNFYGVNYDESIAGLVKMAVSDEFICFTYLSISYNEAHKIAKASNEILSFNWKGEKLKKYILPFPISLFCIDNNYIYGIKYSDEETIIYRFKL